MSDKFKILVAGASDDDLAEVALVAAGAFPGVEVLAAPAPAKEADAVRKTEPAAAAPAATPAPDKGLPERLGGDLFFRMNEGFALHEIICDKAGRPVDYRFLEINPAFETLTGLKREALVGHTVLEVLPTTEKRWIEAYGRVALTQEPIRFEDFAGAVGKSYMVTAFSPKRGQFAVIFSDISERKRTEEALKSERMMLARTESVANVGSWVWDIATDAVTWSDELFRIFQWDPRKGAPNFSEQSVLYYPEDMARLIQAVKTAVADGTPYELELRANRKDGETRVCVSRGVAEMGPGGKPVRLFGSLQDITERKRTKEALRAGAELHKTILRTAMSGFWLADTQGRLLEVNEAYCRMSGYTEPELLAMSITDLETAEAHAETAAHIKKIMAAGQDRFESRHRRKDGGFFNVEVSVQYLVAEGGRFVAFLRDITERKKNLNALVENSRILSMAQTAARAGIWDWDIPSGRLNWSPEFYELFGLSPDAPASFDTWKASLHPDDVKAAGERIERSVANRTPLDSEYRVVRPGGEIIWISAKGAAAYGADGAPLRMTGICLDITGRKNTEAALAESQEEYRAIFEQSPIAIELYDPAGVLISVNSACREMFGVVDVKEIAGFKLFEDPNLAGDKKTKLLNKERVRFEAEFDFDKVNSLKLYRTTCSGIKILDWSIAPLVSGGLVAGYVVQLQDITGRRAAERATLEAKALMDSVVENAPLMIFLKEAKYLRFVVFNRAGEELLGYDRKDLLGSNNLDLFPPEQAALFMTKDREVLDGGTGFLDIPEEPIMTANKGERLLHTRKVRISGADGKSKYLLGISEDITERRKAEKVIQEAYKMQQGLNKMLANSLENIPVREKLGRQLASLFELPWLALEPYGAIFTMDAGGKTLRMAAHQGLPPAALASCASVPLGKCLCGKAAGSAKPVTGDSSDPRHDIAYEGMRPHSHYCAPIIASGKVLGVLNIYLKAGTAFSGEQEKFISSAIDVLAENILHAQVEESLRHSQKIEAVGRLAGGVAHDFNNIMGAITGYAEFLRDDLPPQDPKLEDVQEILKAADRATVLTRQLTAFSRRQMLSPRVVDLNLIIGDMSSMLMRLIGEDVQLVVKPAVSPCPAKVDTGQIEQVIMNLAVNARDAMPKGGTFTLETELVSPDKAFFEAHPDLRRGRLVRLTLSDSGDGMTDEAKSHLFEPFFTTKERGKGTGLGLSMVQGIVKQSGGEIIVESAPDTGTAFHIYFPHEEEAVKDKDKDKDKIAPVKGLETILLVDDDAMMLRVTARLLRDSGYTVLTAPGGKEALKLLKERRKPVDLLLTDVVMPGMTGRELAQEAARRKQAARTLYMSGHADDAIVDHGVLEPGLEFIHKPFTHEDLLLKVRSVLSA